MFTQKQIWALLIPLMIEQVLTSFMGTVDTLMVTTAGSAAISAVSLVDSINVLVIYLFSAMATGGSILCAQYLGNRQVKEANAAGKQLVLAVSAVSLAGTALCVALRVPLLKLIFGSVAPDVMQNALVYFLITALSYPFIALYNSGAALFRADGNSRLPMTVSTVSNVLNIAGNAVLIFGFRLGVAGAALSTLASRVFCAAVILILLRQPRQRIVVRGYHRLRPDFPVILRILKIGIPTGIENGMFQFGKLAIQSTMSTLGTVAIAGNALVAMLEQFTSTAPIGIGLGMMTLVGQCIGAGETEQAVRYTKKLSFYGFVALLLLSALACAAVTPLTWVSRMEPDAAAIAIRLTIFVHVIKPFPWPFSFLPAYGMRAAGDVRFSMTVSAVTMWTCRVLVTVLLVRVWGFGPIAMWIGMASDWTVRGVIFALRLRSRRWLGHRVIS